MSRAFTKEEVRKMIIDHIRVVVREWSSDREPYKGTTIEERCSGVAFSILVMLDGRANGLPAFALIPLPHPDDQAAKEAEGENYFAQPPKAVDDCDVIDMSELHTLFYKNDG